MAFTDPSTSVWHRASLLNELVDAINNRYLVPAMSRTGNLADQVVATTTIVQRGSFWTELQGYIEYIINASGFTPWVKSYSAGSPLSGPGYYDDKATVDRYTGLSDVLGTLGKTGSEYQDGEGGYSWRRKTISGWGTADNLHYGDVVSNYLVEDMQAVLEALIWTQGSSSTLYVSWELDWPTTDGYGQGFNADRVTALNLAIADYATGVNDVLLTTPGGLMKWDGNLHGEAAKVRAKAWVDDVREDGYQKDLYFFGYVTRHGTEWSDQGEGVTEDTMHVFETLADITNGNNGANSFKTTGHFGAADWANSPTDMPSGVNIRGWDCDDSPVIIDWRDGLTYY
jgi:hypothetical protein